MRNLPYVGIERLNLRAGRFKLFRIYFPAIHSRHFMKKYLQGAEPLADVVVQFPGNVLALLLLRGK